MEAERGHLREKLGEKAIEEGLRHLAEGVRDFAKAIGGEALIQTGGMLGDQFKYWRFRNMLRLLDQSAAVLRKRGVNPAQVLPSHLVPLLEAASLTDDAPLKEKWANLLANAADPTRRIGHTGAYVEMLRQLSSAEADLLQSLFDAHRADGRVPVNDYGVFVSRHLAAYRSIERRHLVTRDELSVMVRQPSAAEPVRASNCWQLTCLCRSSAVHPCADNARHSVHGCSI